MKFVLLTLIALSFLSPAAFSKSTPKPKPTKQVEGTFLGTDFGDYLHLNIDVNGTERSFWVYSCKPLSCEDLIEKPEKFEGKKLRVTYETNTVFVPEANAYIEQDQTVSIRVVP